MTEWERVRCCVALCVTDLFKSRLEDIARDDDEAFSAGGAVPSKFTLEIKTVTPHDADGYKQAQEAGRNTNRASVGVGSNSSGNSVSGYNGPYKGYHEM